MVFLKTGEGSRKHIGQIFSVRVSASIRNRNAWIAWENDLGRNLVSTCFVLRPAVPLNPGKASQCRMKFDQTRHAHVATHKMPISSQRLLNFVLILTCSERALEKEMWTEQLVWLWVSFISEFNKSLFPENPLPSSPAPGSHYLPLCMWLFQSGSHLLKNHSLRVSGKVGHGRRYMADANKACNASRSRVKQVTKGPAEPRCRSPQGSILFSQSQAVRSRINAARHNWALSSTAV